jgi:hypothetical protein
MNMSQMMFNPPVPISCVGNAISVDKTTCFNYPTPFIVGEPVVTMMGAALGTNNVGAPIMNWTPVQTEIIANPKNSQQQLLQCQFTKDNIEVLRDMTKPCVMTVLSGKK